MLFSSAAFIFGFLPAVTAGYLLLARVRPSAALLFLIAASYVFYLAGEQLYPWLLAVSCVGNYGAARLLSQPGKRRLHGRIFGLALGANLACLIYFKGWFGVVASSLNLSPGAAVPAGLPLGVSFFTFTQIAFLVDVYRGRTTAGRLSSYAAFVGYYPHLIAGPILHHQEMVPQFDRPSDSPIGRRLFLGLIPFAIGLAKKTIIADPLGSVANGVFATFGPANPPSFWIGWIGAIAYTLQIYFDFSAYSDMAIGVSKMLGIDLPINFNSPYKSRDIVEFWRRWHITLSRFLRDYLYVPLGGNRCGPARRYVNTMLTMLIGGMWHGAGWTFLLWGAIHGAAQCTTHLWRAQRGRFGLPRLPATAGWALTMLVVIFGWVAFRAPDLGHVVTMWTAMLGLDGFALPALRSFAWLGKQWGVQAVDFGTGDLLLMTAAAAIVLLGPNAQQMLARFEVGLESDGYAARGRPGRIQLGGNILTALSATILLGLGLRQLGGSQAFIYFRF